MKQMRYVAKEVVRSALRRTVEDMEKLGGVIHDHLKTCQAIQSGNRSWGRSVIENVTFCYYLRSLFSRGTSLSSSSLLLLVNLKEPVDLF